MRATVGESGRGIARTTSDEGTHHAPHFDFSRRLCLPRRRRLRQQRRRHAVSVADGFVVGVTLDRGSTAAKGGQSANTAAVVAAANAFLAGLTAGQRDAVLHDFADPAKQAGWSNLPSNVVHPNGIPLAQLDHAQRQAVMKVLDTALSNQGYRQVQDILAADDYLHAYQLAYAPAKAAGFGSGTYYVSFFGAPSEQTPFALQFSGHHLAENITYSAGRVSLAPEFVGVEPPTFRSNGKWQQPLAKESSSVIAMVDSLTPAQRATARIPGSFDDLLLGAQNDGPFPAEPEGVLVSDLSAGQQQRVTTAIRAWVDDLDEHAGHALVKKYISQYDQTRIGWSGATSLADVSTYIRIDGPAVWIEFSDQAGRVTNKIHYHSVYRDQTADYGN